MAALEAIPVSGRLLSLSHAVGYAAPADGTAIPTTGSNIITIFLTGVLGGQSGALIMFGMFVLNNTTASPITVQLKQNVISSDGSFTGPVFMTITIPASSQWGGVWTYRAKTFPGAKAADGRFDSTFSNNTFNLVAIPGATGVQTGTGNSLSVGQSIVLLHISGN